MFKKIVQSIKDVTHVKDVLLWFTLSFVGVFAVFVFVAGRSVNTDLWIETFGFAAVFVIMMIGTKSYGNFTERYYQRFIDRENKKSNSKRPKKGKKRR